MFFTLTSRHSSINDRLFTFFKCFYIFTLQVLQLTHGFVGRFSLFFLYSDFKKRILDKTDFCSDLGGQTGSRPLSPTTQSKAPWAYSVCLSCLKKSWSLCHLKSSLVKQMKCHRDHRKDFFLLFFASMFTSDVVSRWRISVIVAIMHRVMLRSCATLHRDLGCMTESLQTSCLYCVICICSFSIKPTIRE